MIWLNPERVMIGGAVLADVMSVAIERLGDGVVAERGGDGPHLVFVDVPAVRIVIRITRRITADEPHEPAIGAEAALSLRTVASASEAGGADVAATVVVTHITYDLKPRTGLAQQITCLAVSADGTTDPVAVTIGGA